MSEPTEVALDQAIAPRRRAVFLVDKPVGAFERAAAKTVDLVVAASIFSVGNAVSYSIGVLLCLIVVLFQDAWGQSIGKRLFGLQVLQDASDRPITLGQSALRNVPFVLGVLFLAIPVFWMLLVVIALPLLALEVWFVFRLQTGVRLGDVLADTHLTDVLRHPFRSDRNDAIGQSPGSTGSQSADSL